jgi:hypothetical protein
MFHTGRAIAQAVLALVFGRGGLRSIPDNFTYDPW